ncbi:MAG: glycosyltransferase family 4 protein [Ilumatobacteraceae bacterium]
MKDADHPRHLVYVITEDWFFKSHFFDRAIAAVRAGYKVTVITRCRDSAREFEKYGLLTENIEFSRRGSNPITELATILKLRSTLKRIKPDIVHNIALKPVVLGSLAAQFAGIRNIVNAPVGMGYVFTSHESKARVLRPIVKVLIRYVLGNKNRRVIIENHDDFENLVSGGFARRDSIALIKGAGVDVQKFSQRPEPNEPVKVIMVSRLLRDKGVYEFIGAAKIVRLKNNNVQFLLVGDTDDGNPTSMNSEEIASLANSIDVTWLGARTDIAELLAESHIACLPSYREGLPKSLIEAASVGRPIVTTDTPGCCEVVTHMVNGLLVQPRDAQALALAIEKLVEDTNLRKSMGEENRHKAEAEYANEIIIGQTHRVYDSFYNL